MATARTAPTTTATSDKKDKKPPVPAGKRISDQLKRAAVGGKITQEELEGIAKLATSLVTFIS